MEPTSVIISCQFKVFLFLFVCLFVFFVFVCLFICFFCLYFCNLFIFKEKQRQIQIQKTHMIYMYNFTLDKSHLIYKTSMLQL
jgi:cell division protein YceG involved in septum cleavage